MNDTLRTEQLANGLTVEFHDHSNRYYGDYHRVRIEVRCRCPLAAGLFAGAADPEAELQSARSALGEEVVFTRVLEQMGVAGSDVEKTRQHLIDSFVQGTFPYMESPAFPARLVAREMEQKKKGRRPFGASG